MVCTILKQHFYEGILQLEQKTGISWGSLDLAAFGLKLFPEYILIACVLTDYIDF